MRLTQQILLAFEGVKKDPAQSLHQAQYTGVFGMSSDFSHANYNAAQKKDKYQTWQQIPFDNLLACDAVLFFATDQNFVFFMAAHLRVASIALEAENLQDDVLDRVVFQLTYEPEKETGLNERYALFNQVQQQAILQFLQDCQQLAIKNMNNGGMFESLFDVAEIPILNNYRQQKIT